MPFWDNFDLNRPGPKYLAVYAGLVSAIERGDLRPGRRLPSHRLLASRLNVGVGTVTRAYEEAREHGLITGEVGRGSFVREHAPAPLAVVDASRIPAGSLDLYQNFPVAIPEIEKKCWSDSLALLRRDYDLAEMARRSWSELSVRNQEAGARWVARTGMQPPPRTIIDCPGVQSALCAVLAATTQPGDTVLASRLSHPGIKLLAEQYHLKIRGLSQDEQGIEPDALEAACREAAPRLLYCAPTIHSPTATTMPYERRRAIAKIARQNDLIIVEDESAAFLLDEPVLPVSAHAPDHSFFIGDVWMALSLGLRTTYVRTPEAMLGAMNSAVAATSGVTTPLIAEIAAQWIESDAADMLIDSRRSELTARNALAQEILSTRTFHSHPCGHHIWLELPQPWTSELFVVRAEQRGIAINSAEWFAIDHSSIPEAVRICIGNAPGRAELVWALRTLDRLIDEPRSSSRPTI